MIYLKKIASLVLNINKSLAHSPRKKRNILIFQYICNALIIFFFIYNRQQERISTDRDEIEKHRKGLTKRKPGGAGPKSIKPEFIKPGQEKRSVVHIFCSPTYLK
jgi:hypothetical protein